MAVVDMPIFTLADAAANYVHAVKAFKDPDNPAGTKSNCLTWLEKLEDSVKAFQDGSVPIDRTSKLEAEHIWSLIRALDPHANKSTCHCGATIYWVHHANGKRAPYNVWGVLHFKDCPEREKFKGVQKRKRDAAQAEVDEPKKNRAESEAAIMGDDQPDLAALPVRKKIGRDLMTNIPLNHETTD